MAKRNEQKYAKWTPPRGIRLIELANCPLSPFAVQWRVDGKRKTKTFPTKEARETFASTLARDVKLHGVTAYRLNEDEARAWRSFVARVGDANLEDIANHWLASVRKTSSANVKQAFAGYLKEKEAEGISEGAQSHIKKWVGRFVDGFGDRDAAAITREDVSGWVRSLDCAPATRRGHLIKLRSFFSWLIECDKLEKNPCAGVKSPKLIDAEVGIYTLEQGCALFEKNAGQPRELLGRMALEAFAGLRFSSAQKITAADIKFAERGIVLPAASIKTERRQFIDGLPDNLWEWLKWSQPENWTMTPRQYLEAKSLARVRADLPEIRNALRHSFCSYHIAAHKDASRTSVILCHTSPAMLWRHYRGNATEADGLAWFKILPPK